MKDKEWLKNKLEAWTNVQITNIVSISSDCKTIICESKGGEWHLHLEYVLEKKQNDWLIKIIKKNYSDLFLES